MRMQETLWSRSLGDPRRRGDRSTSWATCAQRCRWWDSGIDPRIEVAALRIRNVHPCVILSVHPARSSINLATSGLGECGNCERGNGTGGGIGGQQRDSTCGGEGDRRPCVGVGKVSLQGIGTCTTCLPCGEGSVERLGGLEGVER